MCAPDYAPPNRCLGEPFGCTNRELAKGYEAWPQTNALHSLYSLMKAIVKIHFLLLPCFLASEDPTCYGRSERLARSLQPPGRAHTLTHVPRCAPECKTENAKRVTE